MNKVLVLLVVLQKDNISVHPNLYIMAFKCCTTIEDILSGFFVPPSVGSPILLVALEKSQCRSGLELPNQN